MECRDQDRIMAYLTGKYDPSSIILYGSYADGTNNLNSDFDALVISNSHEKCHDTSFVSGVMLDVFVYPKAYFHNKIDGSEFDQIADGKIVYDPAGEGAKLMEAVRAYVRDRQSKGAASVVDDIRWCQKMLERTLRDDAEGMYRWHWLLVDSLEIYCNAVGQPYKGPKKALIWMQEQQPRAYELYYAALSRLTQENLAAWVAYLSDLRSADH